MRLFPEEYLSGRYIEFTAAVYWDYYDTLTKYIAKCRNPRTTPRLLLFLTIIELEAIVMKKKGNANVSSGLSGGNSGGSRPNVQWVNVNIVDTDSEILANEPYDVSDITAMVCEFIAAGWSFAVKPMDGGDSIMAYIIGQPIGGEGRYVGVSAFASNAFDAMCCLCFKIQHKCSGQLPLPTGDAEHTTRRFR